MIVQRSIVVYHISSNFRFYSLYFYLLLLLSSLKIYYKSLYILSMKKIRAFPFSP